MTTLPPVLLAGTRYLEAAAVVAVGALVVLARDVGDEPITPAAVLGALVVCAIVGLAWPVTLGLLLVAAWRHR